MRALVYDNTLFVDDVTTPCDFCYKPATLIKLYPNTYGGPIRLVIDVVFDHRPREVSCGHFFEGIKYLEEDSNELFRRDNNGSIS